MIVTRKELLANMVSSIKTKDGSLRCDIYFRKWYKNPIYMVYDVEYWKLNGEMVWTNFYNHIYFKEWELDGVEKNTKKIMRKYQKENTNNI